MTPVIWIEVSEPVHAGGFSSHGEQTAEAELRIAAIEMVRIMDEDAEIRCVREERMKGEVWR